MVDQKVEFLTGLTGGPSSDGTSIMLEPQVGGKTTEPFAIQIQDVPSVMGVMLSDAIHASERLTDEQKKAISEFPQHATPRVTSIAIGPSDVGQHETLHIRFGVLEIRALVHVDHLTQMVEKLGRPAGRAN
ncbi:hypothetical protein [Bradyrhizobium sp. USDA 4529]